MAELLLLAVAASLVNQCAFLGQFGPRCAVPERHRAAAAATLGLTMLGAWPLAAAAATWAFHLAGSGSTAAALSALLLAVLAVSLASVAVTLAAKRQPALRDANVGLAPLAVSSSLIIALACLRPDQCASVANALGRGAAAAAAFAIVQAVFTRFAERLAGGDEPASLHGVPALVTATGLLMLGIAGLGGLATP